jgi:nitrate/nitrite transporter NarK
VPASGAVRTPQFPLRWMTVFGNAVGGLALISSSKTIMTDIWSSALPEIVTASFATGYVATLGSANSFGRLTWGIASDKLGRKNTYTIFALGLPIMASVPYLITHSMEAVNPSAVPLGIFVGGSVFAIVNYGGIFTVLPAYIADMYG